MNAKQLHKECSVCHAILPLGMFYAARHGKDGRRIECKICTQARRKEAKKGETPGPAPIPYHSHIAIDMTANAVAERARRVEVYAAQIQRGEPIAFFPGR